MKRICVFFLFLSVSGVIFSQSRAVQKLYDLYEKREFVKCVEKADRVLKRNEDEYEAYYVKALAYFEMAQLPERYTDFTRDPLMESLRALSILQAQDPDSDIFHENEEQLQIIYDYTEYYAEQIRERNQKKSITYLQRLMRAFRKETGALDLAKIYAKSGNYEECMRQVTRLYERAPESISSSNENYEALIEAPHLLAENWMFRDLFWIVKNYKPKFGHNYAINNAFKEAIKLSIDTARDASDKKFFYSFSQQGLEHYGDDKAFVSHVEKQWIRVVDDAVREFKKSSDTIRTWRDSIHVRNAFNYISMAREIMPSSTRLQKKHTEIQYEFHVIPREREKSLIRAYALEAINSYRDEGCECDTGQVIYMKPVFTVEWDTILHSLAEKHAQSMFNNNFTKHIDPITGDNPWDRINSTLLRGETFENDEGRYYIKAEKIGEVLGHGHSLGSASNKQELDSLVNTVVDTWMNARFSQNCVKIMKPQFSHMGIAVYGDKWVLLFAEINEVLINSY
ncbi:MAG: CAP domain-containing protein [Bacteroidales bacterium]